MQEYSQGRAYQTLLKIRHNFYKTVNTKININSLILFFKTARTANLALIKSENRLALQLILDFFYNVFTKRA